MRGKKRPAQERAAVVGLATVVGVHDAAQKTGIPERTIRDWFQSAEFAELRQRKKDEVAEEWWAGVQRGMRAVIDGFSGEAPLRDKALAVGVLFDKLALMRGEVTARSETRDLTHELTPDVKRELADWARGRLDVLDGRTSGRPDGDTEPADVDGRAGVR